MIKTIFYFAGAFIILVAPLYAGDTATLKCDFDKYSTEDKSNQKGRLSLTFIFDFKSQKTYLLGNNGTAAVESVQNKAEQSMTFVEITDAGNVMITTVNQKTNKAVHSRHTVFYGELMPSQYYGLCKAL